MRTLIYRVAPRSVDKYIRLLVVLTVILIGADLGGYFDRSGVIPTSAIGPLQGREYVVHNIAEIFAQSWITGLFYPNQGDSNSDPQTSGLRLFEDGGPIGPPHSAHQAIAEQGGGRYSHWVDHLRFSSSDNSDPRINGHLYFVVEAPAIWRLLVIPGLLIVSLVAWRQRPGVAQGFPELNLVIGIIRSDRTWFAAIGTLAAYIVGYYIVGVPPIPLIAPDTYTYWTGSGIVPIGYPIFLWTIHWLFGSLKAIVIVQVAVFAAAIITVQFGIRRITGSPVVAGITAIVLLVMGNAASTSIYLLTESLATSLILFHVAAAACALKRPTRLNLAMLALTAILASAIRPAACFLFGGIIFLALFRHGQRRIIFQRAGVSLVVFMLVYYGVGQMVRGQAGQSITGLALFPHVAHLYEGPSPGMSTEMAAVIDNPILESYKLEREKAPTWQARQLLEMNNFNNILHQLADNKILIEKYSNGRINEILASLSFYLIVHHPAEYLGVVGENLGAWAMDQMFAISPYVSQVLCDDYAYQWDQIRNFYKDMLGEEVEVTLFDVKSRYCLINSSQTLPAFAIPSRWRTPIKIAFWTITVAAGVSFVLGYAGTTAAFVAYVGVLTVGGALLVALSTVFIPRYSIPLDPLVLIVVVVGCWQVLVSLREYLVGIVTRDRERRTPITTE